ncbi:hypothetical protein [Pedococcus bigeumensis]|uniref:hypothetical protein n=1 Tax=Pedococcus bigeumensis TaxID=433644 RepID=UPI002FE85B49
MPGEIAIFLLGAQGGVADDFARLHAVTNPMLLRYLRATADGDHAELARTAWTSVVPQLQVCPADDDAWLELVVGAARTAVLAADGATALAPTGTTTAPSGSEPDSLTQAVAALRACPPAEAEVLAMGAIANLGRDAVSRLTGLEPNAVLALVLQGQQHLRVSLESLIDALRVPATPGEVVDLPFAAGLFAAGAPASPARLPVAAPAPATGALATAGTGAGAAMVPVGALQQPSVVDIHSLQSSAPASAQRTLGTPSRAARAGAAAAAWLLAVGGISTAAAMSGLLSVAIDGILGRDRGPLVTADGPVVPGPLPTTGRPNGTPSPGRVPTPTPANPSTGTPGSDGRVGSGRADQVVELPSGPTRIQVVVASFDPNAETPSTPSETPTPTPTPTEPPAPSPPPEVPTPTTPRPPVVPAGNGEGNGKGQAVGKNGGKGRGNGTAKPALTGNGHTTHQGKQGKHLAKGHGKAGKQAAQKAKAAKQAAKQAAKKAKAAKQAKGHTNSGKR